MWLVPPQPFPSLALEPSHPIPALRLATKLGYCNEPPKGVCSRAFVEAGSHNTNFDGVCFYPRWSLPGYAAIFR